MVVVAVSAVTGARVVVAIIVRPSVAQFAVLGPVVGGWRSFGGGDTAGEETEGDDG